ncbi:MAG: hypothetical protein LBE38_03610 [Deltaproteobacteria bacterium]|jgi:hypothetical protein|nr:hypothetical protein [Deltaproteobacteria bacterium]
MSGRPLFLALGTLVLLGSLLLSGCQAGKPYERRTLYPEKTFDTTVASLGGLLANDSNPSKLYPDGVRVTGYVLASYRGGPLNKELIRLASNDPKEVSSSPSVLLYCAREIPQGAPLVTVGQNVTVAGFVYFSSSEDTIFLAECQVLP